MDTRTTTTNTIRRTNQPARSRCQNYLIILIILGAFTLRIYRLGYQCFSGDEAFTTLNWTQSLDYVFGTIALIDPQPPGALLTFNAWIRTVGYTEVAARYFSVLINTLTVAIIHNILRRFADRKVALLAAFLWAISPYQIWHAQDVNNYSLWGCLSLLSTWFLLQTLARPARFRTWVFYTLVTIYSLYTFYLEAFQIFAQNLFVLIMLLTFLKNQKLLRNWIIAQVTIILSLTPWLISNPRLVMDSGYSPTGHPIPNPLGFIHTITLGENLPPALQTNPAIIVTVAILVLVIACAMLYPRWRPKLIALLLFLTSPLLLTTLTLITHRGYWRPHYLHASAGAYILVMAIAGKRSLGKLAIVVATALSLLGLSHYYFNPEAAKAPDWRALMTFFETHVAPDDLIVITYPDPALPYYYQGEADHAILPREQYAPIEETAPLLEAALDDYSRIWLLPVESDYHDRDRTVRRWMNDNAQLIDERYVEQFQLRQYASWEANEDEIAYPMNACLGDLVALVGYNISTTDAFLGEELTLELYWLPIDQNDVSLTVFTHLLGPPRPDDSILWAQDDHPPHNWRANTTTWEVGTLLRDVYHITIPTDAPPGEYILTTGLYNPATGERLPVECDDAPTPDSVVITTITIVQP